MAGAGVSLTLPIRMDGAPAPPRLTTLGRISLWFAALATAAGLALFSGPVLAAGLAALALIGACRYLAGRHLDGFTVERSLPRRAWAGESFPVETAPCPGPRFPQGNPLRFTDPLAPAVRGRLLESDRTSRLSLRCTGLATRRGPLPRRPWTLASTWPLGLFLAERQGSFRDDHALLVLPKPWLPSRLRQRLEHLAAGSVERPLEPADPLAEFRLLREFRTGDPVRGIHWPASLRSGRLQFAETEPPRPRPLRYGVFLHSFEPPGTVIVPEHWEQILRIATGLLLRFRREGVPVVFRQAPGKAATLRDPGDFSQWLDILALARRHPITVVETLFAPTDPGEDPFTDCDEVFVLGDGDLAHWEPAARARFPHCTCLDPSEMTTGSRPGLLARVRTRT